MFYSNWLLLVILPYLQKWRYIWLGDCRETVIEKNSARKKWEHIPWSQRGKPLQSPWCQRRNATQHLKHPSEVPIKHIGVIMMIRVWLQTWPCAAQRSYRWEKGTSPVVHCLWSITPQRQPQLEHHLKLTIFICSDGGLVSGLCFVIFFHSSAITVNYAQTMSSCLN